MPADFARLEAARLARGGRDLTAPVTLADKHERIGRPTSFRRTDFAVGREYEDGRFVPTHTNLTRDLAETVAGRMRDESSDVQVQQQLDEHWTWAYRQQRGGNAEGKRRAPFVPTRRVRP